VRPDTNLLTAPLNNLAMPVFLKAISPFYNDHTTPPAFPSMLTNQLELFTNAHHSTGILANETITSSGRNMTTAFGQTRKVPDSKGDPASTRLTVQEGDSHALPDLTMTP
jgi:hypothetical protein